MRILTLLLGLTLSVGSVANSAVEPTASEQQTLTVPSLVVKHRLQAIEQINVTAEKTAKPLDDAELQAILKEAQRLEHAVDHPDQKQPLTR